MTSRKTANTSSVKVKVVKATILAVEKSLTIVMVTPFVILWMIAWPINKIDKIFQKKTDDID